MRIRIVHDTTYDYERPVKSLIQTLRLTPRDHDGQHVIGWRIEPSVDGLLRAGEDTFGNITHVFSAEGGMTQLGIRVSGDVETNDTDGFVRGVVERAPEPVYLRETPLTETDDAIRDFAMDLSAQGGETLTVLHRLLDHLHNDLTFDTKPTQVFTTAAEAFKMRAGVCQDLSHIFISAARHLGIPSRYVSGYFFRSDGVTDQAAGHAWAEAKVPDLGWIGFDPANGICVGEAHVRLATGLDYLSAAPVRGARYGGGSETLDVSLTVENARQ